MSIKNNNTASHLSQEAHAIASAAKQQIESHEKHCDEHRAELNTRFAEVRTDLQRIVKKMDNHFSNVQSMIDNNRKELQSSIDNKLKSTEGSITMLKWVIGFLLTVISGIVIRLMLV